MKRPVRGRRAYTDNNSHLLLAEGDYGFDPRTNRWMVRPPRCHTGDLRNHTVTEHKDGTISVTPSILLMKGPGKVAFHGYLTRGMWRACE